MLELFLNASWKGKLAFVLGVLGAGWLVFHCSAETDADRELRKLRVDLKVQVGMFESADHRLEVDLLALETGVSLHTVSPLVGGEPYVGKIPEPPEMARRLVALRAHLDAEIDALDRWLVAARRYLELEAAPPLAIELEPTGRQRAKLAAIRDGLEQLRAGLGTEAADRWIPTTRSSLSHRHATWTIAGPRDAVPPS